MSLLTRKQFVSLVGGAFAGAGLGAIARISQSDEAAGASGRAQLRPPGASANEGEFLAACTRCGQCIETCPVNALHLTTLSSGFGAGTPYFIAEEVPCNLCMGLEDLECIRTCPTNALEDIDRRDDVRIGLAVVNEETCWPFNGIACRLCWHACPWPNEAIMLDERLRPVVNADHCTGCGLCEHACPTEERKSIIVLPMSVVVASSGAKGDSG